MNKGNKQVLCEKPYFKASEIDDHSKRIVLQAVHKAQKLYYGEDEMAKSIRIDLNDALGGYWHVIAGKYFASYFTYTPGCMAHVQLGDLQFLVYQFN